MRPVFYVQPDMRSMWPWMYDEYSSPPWTVRRQYSPYAPWIEQHDPAEQLRHYLMKYNFPPSQPCAKTNCRQKCGQTTGSTDARLTSDSMKTTPTKPEPKCDFATNLLTELLGIEPEVLQSQETKTKPDEKEKKLKPGEESKKSTSRPHSVQRQPSGVFWLDPFGRLIFEDCSYWQRSDNNSSSGSRNCHENTTTPVKVKAAVPGNNTKTTENKSSEKPTEIAAEKPNSEASFEIIRDQQEITIDGVPQEDDNIEKNSSPQELSQPSESSTVTDEQIADHNVSMQQADESKSETKLTENPAEKSENDASFEIIRDLHEDDNIEETFSSEKFSQSPESCTATNNQVPDHNVNKQQADASIPNDGSCSSPCPEFDESRDCSQPIVDEPCSDTDSFGYPSCDSECPSECGGQFQVTFDLSAYPADDIRVTSADSRLNVQACRVCTEHGVQYEDRLHRTVSLPPNVDTESLKCRLTDAGILTITADYVKQNESVKILSIERSD